MKAKTHTHIQITQTNQTGPLELRSHTITACVPVGNQQAERPMMSKDHDCDVVLEQKTVNNDYWFLKNEYAQTNKAQNVGYINQIRVPGAT